MGYSRHSNLTMTGSYHKSDMNDKIRGSLALQGQNADKIVQDGTIGMLSILCCI
jgi:hypothetical protein